VQVRVNQPPGSMTAAPGCSCCVRVSSSAGSLC